MCSNKVGVPVGRLKAAAEKNGCTDSPSVSGLTSSETSTEKNLLKSHICAISENHRGARPCWLRGSVCVCVCVCEREWEMQTLLSENTSFTHITQKHLTVRKREQDWSQMAPESTMVITVFKTVPRQLVMHEIKIIGRSRTKLKLCWRPNTVFHIYFPPVAIFCFFFFHWIK